jgi:Ulp1 family protease
MLSFAVSQFRHVKVLEHEVVMFPVNTSNVHWALVVVRLRERTAFYIDSFLKGTIEQKKKTARTYVCVNSNFRATFPCMDAMMHMWTSR